MRQTLHERVMKMRLYPAMLVAFLIILDIFTNVREYFFFIEFPEDEFKIRACNVFFRDIMLGSVFLLAFSLRRRIYRFFFERSYFPVLVVGILYSGSMLCQVRILDLDLGVLTTFSFLTGLASNTIGLYLIAAFYEKLRGKITHALYFLSYVLHICSIFVDTIYFLNTSSHVEHIVFQNLNLYSITGVLSGFDMRVVGMIVFGLLSFCLAFFLKRTSPNSYSNRLLYTIVLVFVLIVLSNHAAGLAYDAFIQQTDYPNIWVEKSKQKHRQSLTVPVAANLAYRAVKEDGKAEESDYVFHSEALTSDEAIKLRELGLLSKKKAASRNPAPAYERVVVIVLESLHRDYLHFYNKTIPAEATQFMDSLAERYPRLDRYYTSNTPTTQGLGAMFKSQILLDLVREKRVPASVFKSFGDQGYQTIFLSSTSQYYENEFLEYPALFHMNRFLAREYMERKGYTGASGWGYRDDVLYQETIDLLKEHRHQKIFLVAKSTDLHQPYPYSGIDPAMLPDTIRNSKYQTLRSLYWEDQCLKTFFHDLESEGLFDEKTLVVLTADHSPHPAGDCLDLVKEEPLRRLAPIPLVLIAKNVQPIASIHPEIYASQVDFAPTILACTGIPSPPEFMGRDLSGIEPGDDFAVGYFAGEIYYKSGCKDMILDLSQLPPKGTYEEAFFKWFFNYYAARFAGKPL